MRLHTQTKSYKMDEEDLQQNAGVENENETIEGSQATETPNSASDGGDISQEKEESSGKVLVQDWLPHRYERMKKQKEQYVSRIQELEDTIKQIGAKPIDRESYGDDVDKYVDDKAFVAAERAFANKELETLKASSGSLHQKYVDEIWTEKMKMASTKYPDLKEKIASAPNVSISGEAQLALKENPMGADIFYHLVSNPDVAGQLQYMSPASQVQYIAQQGAFIQMLNHQQKQTVKPQQPSQVSNVPRPLENVSTSRPVSNTIDLEDYVASYRNRRR